MSLKSYLIAPYELGEQRDVEPFLLPEAAFETLEDAYVWRGRVKKRWGENLVGATPLESRFRINLGNTDGAGAAAGNVPGAIYKVGQMFSIGTDTYTVNATGTPAATLTSGAGGITYNTTTGAYVVAGAAATTAVYFYPSEPVMGLATRENTGTNNEDIIGFDTQFSYRRVAQAWEVVGTAAADLWTGTNSQFVWTTNYRGANPYDTNLYATNFKARNAANDGLKYLPSGATAWTNQRPQLDSGAGTRFLDGCRIIIGFKDRLVALSTLETDGGAQTFPQRCRFSQNGDPTNNATSWLDDVPGVGGYIDAPTKEIIVTAALLKDRLIVYFERSTWELVYTRDNILPFRWQQIDSELGAESTFGIVGFDKQAVGVGNRGIHACDGSGVARIDPQIPDFVQEIQNANNGTERVYGIRDFGPEMVYWAYPDADLDPTFPNRVLVFNYVNQSYAIFRDSFTCFGHFYRESTLTWNDLGAIYGTWDNWHDAWSSGAYQSAFPQIIAGNQEGWTLTLDTGKSSNAPSLQITDMTAPTTLTIIDHNLAVGDFILVNSCTGITSLNGLSLKVMGVTDANNITIDPSRTFSGTYTGGGTVQRVSGLNIRTKRFNPGTPIGQAFSMPYLDLLLGTTESGEFSLDYYQDGNDDTSVNESASPGALFGSNVVWTKPEATKPEQDKNDSNWHRYFLSSDFQFVQLRMFLSDAQLGNVPVATSNWELMAMILYVSPGGRITG